MSNKASITLTRGQKAIIDKEDLAKVSKHKWYASQKRKNGRFYAKSGNTDLHRLVMGKNVPARCIISFKNGNSLDCRKVNLVIRKLGDPVVRNQKTNANRKMLPDLSKFVGVRVELRFAAEFVDANGRIYNFGLHKTPHEAAIVYNKQMKVLQKSLNEKVKFNPEDILK